MIQISSGFCIPKNIKIGWFLTALIEKKEKVGCRFATQNLEVVRFEIA